MEHGLYRVGRAFLAESRPVVALLLCVGLSGGVAALASPAPVAGAAALSPQSSAPQPIISSSDWLGEINYYRTGSGLAAVTNNSSWTQGIADHLVYLAKTPASYFTGQYQSLHTENPASPYYTALGAQEAARSDLLEGAVGATPTHLIDGWLAAPFHAIGILRQGLSQVAFAYDPTTGDAGLDILSGLDSSQSPPSSPILFPGDGLSTDLSVYSGGEAPDPLETCGWQGQNVGLPLIALLTKVPSASLTATLTAQGGVSESSAAGTLCVVDSSTYHSSDPVYGPTGAAILSGDDAVVLIPRQPLANGAYSVSINQPGSQPLSWSFEEAPITRFFSLRPGAARAISAGANGAVWVVGTNQNGAPGYEIYQWTDGAWAGVPGAGVRIAVAPNGSPWVTNSAHEIYRRVGSAWVLTPGAATDLAIGANGAVWAVGTNPTGAGDEIYQWTGRGWAGAGGSAVAVAVDPNGNPWIINSAHQIYRRVGSGWAGVPGAGTAIAIGADGAVWVVGTNPTGAGYGVYHWTGSTWAGMGGSAVDIAVDQNGNPWVINSSQQIYFG